MICRRCRLETGHYAQHAQQLDCMRAIATDELRKGRAETVTAVDARAFRAFFLRFRVGKRIPQHIPTLSPPSLLPWDVERRAMVPYYRELARMMSGLVFGNTGGRHPA